VSYFTNYSSMFWTWTYHYCSCNSQYCVLTNSMKIVYCTCGRVSVRVFPYVWSFTSYIRGP